MPTGPAPLPDAVFCAPAPGEATARHLQTLSLLTDAGLAIALDLQAQIRAFTPPPPDPAAPPPHPLDLFDVPTTLGMARASADLALAFARVSRAVRLSIALHDRLAKGEGAEPRAARAVPRAAVERSVEEPEVDTERPCRERLSDRERLDALLDRPVEELIARICADLGLSLPPVGRVADAQRQTGGWAPSLNSPRAPVRVTADQSSSAGAPPPVRPAAGHPPRFGRGKAAYPPSG